MTGSSCLMRQFLYSVFALASARTMADGQDTSAFFPGWTIATSEVLYAGKRHTSYPIANMLDGDPRTAWVFSGQEMKEPEYRKSRWGSSYALEITPVSPLRIDSVRIMNGYNKDVETFRKNDRIVELAIYEGSKWPSERRAPIKTAALSDKMGWHEISLPRKKYKNLILVITGIRRGKDRDVCVSELELVHKGRKLPMNKWQMYATTSGSDCG